MGSIIQNTEFFLNQVKRCKSMDDLIDALENHIHTLQKFDQCINTFFKSIYLKLPFFSKYRPTNKDQLLNSLSWDDQYVLLKAENSKGEFDGFITTKKI